jgi:hypothetical protein
VGNERWKCNQDVEAGAEARSSSKKQTLEGRAGNGNEKCKWKIDARSSSRKWKGVWGMESM